MINYSGASANTAVTKDWSGNSRSTFVTLGASNHVEAERQSEDYYATDPKAVELLLNVEAFNKTVWEPACGGGHISKVLEAHGYDVISTDLVYRGYGNTESVNFLLSSLPDFDGDIITNPPYKYALDFVQHALDVIPEGGKVAMFLKLLFLEGKERKQFFLENPPKTIYVLSSRLLCAKNGEFEKYTSGAVAYAWFVWVKGFKGDPVIKWVN